MCAKEAKMPKDIFFFEKKLTKWQTVARKRFFLYICKLFVCKVQNIEKYG